MGWSRGKFVEGKSVETFAEEKSVDQHLKEKLGTGVVLRGTGHQKGNLTPTS